MKVLILPVLIFFSSVLAGAASLGECASTFLPTIEYTGKFKNSIEAMSQDELSLRVNSAVGFRVEIGALNRPMCTNCIYLDLFTQGLRTLEGPKLVANATHLPFRDESIDQIVLRDFPVFVTVGFHVQFLKDVMSEFRRVLKKEGVIYFVSTRWTSDSFYYVYLENPTAEHGIDYLKSKDFLSGDALFEQQHRHQAQAAEAAGFQASAFTADWMSGLVLRRR